MTRAEFKAYARLKRRLEQEIEEARGNQGPREMPDDVWEDEARRMDWITQDKEQWNYNNSRVARLKRLYDRCFPKKSWVIAEIESFFEDDGGPLY